jgi:hypothetical protein
MSKAIRFGFLTPANHVVSRLHWRKVTDPSRASSERKTKREIHFRLTESVTALR